MRPPGFKIGLDPRTNRIVHIDHVCEGFEFAVCPDCRSPLVSANRNPLSRKRDTYFRHGSEGSCGPETLIHLWAKQVISDKCQVRTPEYISTGVAKDLAGQVHRSTLKTPSEVLHIGECQAEKRLYLGDQWRTPDVSCVVMNEKNSALYLEIHVNHEVDGQKQSFFKHGNFNCLEIDLRNVSVETLSCPDEFADYVIDTAPRSWVNCALYEAEDAWTRKDAERKARIANEARLGAQNRGHREHEEMPRTLPDAFGALVRAYRDPSNRMRVTSLYERQLTKPDNISYEFHQHLCKHYGAIPRIANVYIDGELGFKCHRSVWQWFIYDRIVIQWSRKGGSVDDRTLGDAVNSLGWYEEAPKWSAEQLYAEMNHFGIPVNRIWSNLDGLREFKGWLGVPTPIQVITRYLDELTNREILDRAGMYYRLRRNADLPVR